MAIPKKITPDHLKDTIVEVRFISEVPLDVFSGVALTLLYPKGYKYTPPPQSRSSLESPQNQQVSRGFGERAKRGFFVKDSIKIQFIGNTIAFNCFEDKYAGWDNYFSSIKEVVSVFVSNNFIKSFDRVSIRYISEFENTDIFSNIKGCFAIDNEVGFDLQDSILRLTKESGKTKVFMTLTNQIKKKKNNNITEVSFFDIHAFVNLPQNAGLEELEEGLTEAHNEQKESFFNILTDDFKESLKPEY